jgi:hypothetical protein
MLAGILLRNANNIEAHPGTRRQLINVDWSSILFKHYLLVEFICHI